MAEIGEATLRVRVDTSGIAEDLRAAATALEGGVQAQADIERLRTFLVGALGEAEEWGPLVGDPVDVAIAWMTEKLSRTGP